MYPLINEPAKATLASITGTEFSHDIGRAMKQSYGDKYTITLDDDPIVHRLIQKSLGIKSLQFKSAEKLVETSSHYQPVAAFVDIHLEADENGLHIIPILKAKWPFCPILVITSDPSDEAVSEALASGADDFVRKPIRPKELAARLQARLIDQAQKEAKNVIHMGDLTLDRTHRILKGPRGERYLSSTEINLFMSLLQAKGTVVPRSALKLRCWGQIAVSDNALDRKIYEVRRALKETGSNVNVGTAYGVGFALETAETPRVPILEANA